MNYENHSADNLVPDYRPAPEITDEAKAAIEETIDNVDKIFDEEKMEDEEHMLAFHEAMRNMDQELKKKDNDKQIAA